MKDLLGLMGKAKEMQAKFQVMQEEIAGIRQAEQVRVVKVGDVFEKPLFA